MSLLIHPVTNTSASSVNGSAVVPDYCTHKLQCCVSNNFSYQILQGFHSLRAPPVTWDCFPEHWNSFPEMFFQPFPPTTRAGLSGIHSLDACLLLEQLVK